MCIRDRNVRTQFYENQLIRPKVIMKQNPDEQTHSQMNRQIPNGRVKSENLVYSFSHIKNHYYLISDIIILEDCRTGLNVSTFF